MMVTIDGAMSKVLSQMAHPTVSGKITLRMAVMTG